MTLAAVILGVTALILSGGFVADVYVQLRDSTIHSRLGYLQLYSNGYYLHGRRNPYEYMIEDPDELIIDLFQIRGVEEILKRVNFSGLINNGRTDLGVIAEGIEPEKEIRLAEYLTVISGRQLDNNDTEGILVGEGLAQSLALSPGDFVTLVANTVDGAMNTVELEIVGIFRSFSKDYDARAVRLHLATASELLDTTSVHALVFSLDSAKRVNKVTRNIEARLSPEDYEVKTWLELDDFYRATKALYERYFLVLQIIILGIVLLSVVNSVNMTANERAGEFGTLRALGQRSRSIFSLIVLENTILAITGSMIGVLLGVGLATAISSVGLPMPPPPNSNSGYTARILLQADTIWLAFAVGCIATIASAMIAAVGACRTRIVDGLRENV